MKKWKKYQLVIVAIIIIAIMLVARLRWGYKGDMVEMKTTNSPTPTVANNSIDEDYGMWNKLPYQGKGFVVEKYIDKKTLQVSVKGVDKKIAIEGVLKWLEENKVATESYRIVIK